MSGRGSLLLGSSLRAPEWCSATGATGTRRSLRMVSSSMALLERRFWVTCREKAVFRWSGSITLPIHLEMDRETKNDVGGWWASTLGGWWGPLERSQEEDLEDL